MYYLWTSQYSLDESSFIQPHREKNSNNKGGIIFEYMLSLQCHMILQKSL